MSEHLRPPAAAERLPEQVIDAAITWAVKLNYSSAAPAARAAFEKWLAADPRHGLAWQRVGTLGQGFSKVPPKLALDALQSVQTQREAGANSRRRALKMLSFAGVALSVGALLRAQAPWQRLMADASTAIGEQRTLRLEDGTVIVLNTDSAVSTDLTGERRLVTLWRGEIRITTGADTAAPSKRPFYVYTPFGKLQALGTRFVVRLEGERARVSVQEGAVALHPAGGGAPVIVQPGESAWLSDEAATTPRAQEGEADAWAEGVIAGKNMRLGDLVAELARYRPGHVACDERVADLRVSGTFHIKDTDRALQFLVQTQPVKITYRSR